MAINAVQLEDFHQIQRTSKTGKRYYDSRVCVGKNELGINQCKYCEDGLVKSFGQAGYLSFGKGYVNNFRDIREVLTKHCSNCGGRAHPMQYVCEHCDELYADLNSDVLSVEDRAQLEGGPVVCPKCGQRGVPKKILKCFKIVNGTATPGCDTPTPLSAFELPLRLKVTGDNPSVLVLDSDKEEIRPTIMDPRAARFVAPLDFPSFLGGMTLKEQAQILGRELPKEFLEHAESPQEVEVGPSTVNYN